ncbi:MAG: hypothetical protein GY791_04530 [Alphaproteobacteria bacterium]|nr:hypothetical protein [Alphaproteobacteria bacterium]
MYVRSGITAKHLFRDSWLFLVFAALWASLVVYVHEILGLKFVAIPLLPVTTVGIAVSLYLGFKSNSAYDRWWEARQLFGLIVNYSRAWASAAQNLIYAPDKEVDPTVQRELIRRHLAWVNALAYQLRKTGRLKESHVTHLFDHRKVFDDPAFHQDPESYRRYLSPAEVEEMERYANPATHILNRQAKRLRELAQDGFLDSYRLVEMMGLLTEFHNYQGKCERLKNTPFPRQVANFGLMFTWVFILLLPLAFVDTFEAELTIHRLSGLLGHEYMFTMVPFTVLISWVFFIMEKVSDSTEDPFEGGATDVPISAITRTIEIDLLQMAGDEEVPPPLQPIDGVLY